jgi:hypothetical protein
MAASTPRRATHANESRRVRPVAPRSSPSLIKSWDPRIARPNSPESASPHLATVITKSARHPCKGAIRPKWNLTRMVCKIKQKEDRSVKLVVNPDRGGDRLDGRRQPAITRPLRTTRAGVPGTRWPKSSGRMAEWFKAPVLKTGRGSAPSWVRIPLLPPAQALPAVCWRVRSGLILSSDRSNVTEMQSIRLALLRRNLR